MTHVKSCARFYYLTDRRGELIRVDPLTGLCSYWLPLIRLWTAYRATYHNVTQASAPLTPFYGPLRAECYRGE